MKKKKKEMLKFLSLPHCSYPKEKGKGKSAFFFFFFPFWNVCLHVCSVVSDSVTHGL